jgi:phage-related baseplate assembly protein
MSLAEPNFVERDPEVIEQQVFEHFTGLTGIALTPNQPEWMFLKTLAYRESLCRIAIQEAAKQNLLQYARFPMLDHLGALIDAPRLEADFGVTTQRFAIDEAAGDDIPIPEGTRVRSKDSIAVFATTESAVLLEGDLYVDVPVRATTAGAQSNGYLPGQISELVDAVPGIDSVANLSLTAGGAPAEVDPRYQERMLGAPDGYTTAGAKEAYEFHARSASSAIEDVVAISDDPLTVRVVLLDDGGNITPEIIELVEAKLTAERVRPQTDQVSVEASDSDDFTIDAELTIYKDADPDTVLELANKAAEAYRISRRKLGRSAPKDQVRARLTVPGVHSMVLSQPAGDVLPDVDSWARCTSVSISIAAVSSEVGDE